MRNRARLIVGVGLMALLPWVGAAVIAQEPPAEEPPATPAAEDQPADDAADTEKEQETTKKLGLYLAFAIGQADVDAFNSSIITRTEVDEVDSAFTLNDEMYARAAIGWKLADEKGDFRLEYRGYSEDTYDLASSGKSARVLQSQLATAPVEWWNLTIQDGAFLAQRTPRWWTNDFDMPGPDGTPPNQRPDPDEVQTTDCSNPNAPFASGCRTVQLSVPENLRNRVQTFDLLYGREFGRRRVSSRWWGGLRYFEYSGQIAAPAWLMSGEFTEGVGFTDGTFLKMLLMNQDSQGLGPTGAWEVDFNFFDRMLVVYIRAQASFLFSNISVNTGPFVTLVKETAGSNILLAEATISEEREKSVWNTAAEIGVRFTLFKSFTIDVGYHRAGFLDAIILPAQIIVPEKEQTISGGVSALYGTQDYKVGGWYAGLAFQF